MKSIKTKLIVYFSILILISSVAIGVVSINKAGEVITKETEKTVEASAQDASALIESKMEIHRRDLAVMATLDSIHSMD